MKERLDVLTGQTGIWQSSREKAKAIIMSGNVLRGRAERG